MISTGKTTICDVCRLLDFDTSEKLCFYCALCDAWICQADQPRWDRRLRAAAKRKLEPLYKGRSDYEQIAGATPPTVKTSECDSCTNSTDTKEWKIT